jgi:hypothetical protein
MKIATSFIFLFLLCSCKYIDDRGSLAKDYVIENWPKRGLNASVIEVEKIDGIEYKNKYDGTDMYAQEFVATCKIDGEGFMLVDKDDIVRNITLFKNNVFEEMNERQRDLFGYKGAIEVHPGTAIKAGSKVIMVKKENGWKPIAIRGDLY